MFLFTSHWSYGNKIYQKVIPKSFPPGFYTTIAFCSLYYFWPTDFSINWAQESTRQSLYNLMIKEKNFRQLISGFTTDNRTIIDHLYTDLIEEKIYAGTLESYFSDHKAIWASLPVRSSNKRNHCVTFILPALINSKQNQFSHMRTITVVILNSLQH